ncbi:Sterol regulatory element-binding protein ECM22 [Zalerion maritima]|uniref:Sterol regulatory element-binding protein ECM22 n=1 Tax=Zalerion maritima TaxID=339359 RepID=A0AAD5WR20_9PEZI|nr:Sterol regulatory element-binding protein ECM22 [Zalerion maritima]
MESLLGGDAGLASLMEFMYLGPRTRNRSDTVRSNNHASTITRHFVYPLYYAQLKYVLDFSAINISIYKGHKSHQVLKAGDDDHIVDHTQIYTCTSRHTPVASRGCTTDANKECFQAAKIGQVLVERNSAIVSLQAEVGQRDPSLGSNKTRQSSDALLRTMILASLILCVSSGWVDPSGKDFGIEFLLGVRGVMYMLSDSKTIDALIFYIIGLFLYCEAFWSYLIPASPQ